jgi:adenosylhomocysteine nucleosidase
VNRGGAAQAGAEAAIFTKVAIVAALEREIRALRPALRADRRWKDGSIRAEEGSLGGVPAIVASTGDGARRAGSGARDVLDRFAAQCMVILGVAGGLSPHLEPGKIVAAREVIEETGKVPPPDPFYTHRLLRRTGATLATFVCTRSILCAAREKSEAYARLPWGSEAAAADLETAAFARAAAERGIPYVALRAISDPAEESLPLDFNALRDSEGSVDGRRVALAALARPWLVPSLWHLRTRVSLCSENLARAAGAFLAGGAP